MPSDYVILYLHIPKAGGTTLAEVLHYQLADPAGGPAEEDGVFHSGIYYYPGLGPGGGFLKDPDLTVPETVEHALARPDVRAVTGHFWFGIHRLVGRPCRYLTLLRHPVARVVSLYHHVRKYYGVHSEKNKRFYRERMVRGRDLDQMSLDEFVADPPFREVDNDQLRRVAGEEPELGGCTRRHLEQAKENLRRHFSVVGVTERFDETLVLMKRRLEWTRDLRYYPRNTNPDSPARDPLSQATVNAILRRNELDAELYDFAVRRLDESIAEQDDGFPGEVQALKERNRLWFQGGPPWDARHG